MSKAQLERLLRSLVRERQRHWQMYLYSGGECSIWFQTRKQKMRVRNEITAIKMFEVYSQQLEREINAVLAMLKHYE
jgi:hypothetical protein